MIYYFYIIRCSDDSLYCGSTNDLNERERKHNEGLGARYTRARRPLKVVYFEKYSSRSEAMKREAQIKSWTKNKKEDLVKQGFSIKKD